MHFMLKETIAAIGVAALAGAGAIDVLPSAQAKDLSQAGAVQLAACNPCATKTCNPCNPCAANACNPCNPCAAKACNPCNPCAANACNPCNPCKPKSD
jgi:hypothetical protein